MESGPEDYSTLPTTEREQNRPERGLAVNQPISQMDQDLGVGAASVGLRPSDPPSLLLPPKLLPQG